MNSIDIVKKLKKSMTIEGIVHPRYYHSLRVKNIAIKLAIHLKLDIDYEKLRVASLLHDCAKLKAKTYLETYIKENKLIDVLSYPSIWHSFVGGYVASVDYGINDLDVLNAIRYHTTGRPHMTIYEQLVFVSDFIEEERTGEVFDKARELCFNNLNLGTLFILENTINYLKLNNLPIYKLTLDTYLYYKEMENINA